jgi:hypothetical protein
MRIHVMLLLLTVLGVGAQGIALTIAGVIVPLVTHAVKGRASGTWALLIAVGVSGVIALAATAIAGDIHSVGDVVKNASAVFGVATVVYKLFTASDSVPAPAAR